MKELHYTLHGGRVARVEVVEASLGSVSILEAPVYYVFASRAVEKSLNFVPESADQSHRVAILGNACLGITAAMYLLSSVSCKEISPNFNDRSGLLCLETVIRPQQPLLHSE